MQEAYLRAFRSFASYRGDGDRAWILAIVRNCHRDWHARSKLDAMAEPLGEDDGDGGDARGSEPASSEESPETSLLRRTEAQEVRRHLEALPEPFREILVLRELEDLSYREIAEITATPIGTVMSRLARARKLFQAAWERTAGAGGHQP